MRTKGEKMRAKELIDYLKQFPEESDVVIAQYEDATGKTTFIPIAPCCNLQHQLKIKQPWFRLDS